MRPGNDAEEPVNVPGTAARSRRCSTRCAHRAGDRTPHRSRSSRSARRASRASPSPAQDLHRHGAPGARCASSTQFDVRLDVAIGRNGGPLAAVVRIEASCWPPRPTNRRWRAHRRPVRAAPRAVDDLRGPRRQHRSGRRAPRHPVGCAASASSPRPPSSARQRRLVLFGRRPADEAALSRKSTAGRRRHHRRGARGRPRS